MLVPRDRAVTSHTPASSPGCNGRRSELLVYLPSRTAAVWARVGPSAAT